MKLIPDEGPEARAERARQWFEGAKLINQINAQRKVTGEEPLVVNQANAPDAVTEAARAEAERRDKEMRDLAESAYKTGRAEAEKERLEQQLRDLGDAA